MMSDLKKKKMCHVVKKYRCFTKFKKISVHIVN